jgi:hypothetical protein
MDRLSEVVLWGIGFAVFGWLLAWCIDLILFIINHTTRRHNEPTKRV